MSHGPIQSFQMLFHSFSYLCFDLLYLWTTIILRSLCRCQLKIFQWGNMSLRVSQHEKLFFMPCEGVFNNNSIGTVEITVDLFYILSAINGVQEDKKCVILKKLVILNKFNNISPSSSTTPPPLPFFWRIIQWKIQILFHTILYLRLNFGRFIGISFDCWLSMRYSKRNTIYSGSNNNEIVFFSVLQRPTVHGRNYFVPCAKCFS